MQPDENGPGNFGGLRQGVKRVMRRLTPASSPHQEELVSPVDQQQLYRTHLYQLELEMQNEELRRTQFALERERARFVSLLEYTSTLYNQAPVGYLTLTAQGVITEANLTAARLLESSREQLLQQPFARWILAEDRPTFHAFYQNLRLPQPAQRCEVRMQRATGTPIFVQIDATFVKDLLGFDESGKINKEHFVRLTLSDISARVALEEEERLVRSQLESTLLDLQQTQEQMVKQERLAVVGQLAAGVAHDFNNILAGITLYSQLVMRAADLPEHLHARMEAIVAQSDRAASLIQQILDFSRRTVLTPQSTSLCTFLAQLTDLLQHTLPETIAIRLEVNSLQANVDDMVEIDPTRIEQVLLNLALNARDAMPNGGELAIRLARFQVEGEELPIASGTLPAGSWLRVDVCDTGTGIQPEDVARLFEPFFTTKGVGKGSGLGLSQVWGIVKQHGGEIDVTSEVGQGSTFSIFLPTLVTTPQQTTATSLNTPEAEEIAAGHGEVILVVEDNHDLRTALVTTLTQLGYQTLDAQNGQVAAQIMTQQGDRVDLILSDLRMPVVGGEELIRNLRAQGWHQPVVVLSGHPLATPELERLQAHGQISWLLKPPAVGQLAATLHRALARDTTGMA